jgi:alkaline phosphatase
MIGADYKGNSVLNIVEKAEKAGMSTGLVSDTRITHATPAGFAAHQPVRSMENEIALDLLQSGIDLMLSGGMRHWLPREVNDGGSEISDRIKKRTGGSIKLTSKRQDNRNLLAEAEKKGYRLVFNKQELDAARKGMVLGLFANSGMPDAFAENADRRKRKRTVPLLSEMTEAALRVLEKNEKGFFLMVEAGQIDWASHGNDAGWLLREMIRFDEVLEAVRKWAAGRKDTLVIVTADHETGGPGFSYTNKGERKEIELSGDLFRERKYRAKFNFGSPGILDRIYRQKMSYEALFNRFDSLPADKKSPEALVKIINSNTEFPVKKKDAERILGLTGHRKRGGIYDFREFYVYPEGDRSSILARVVAGDQNMVWSTGAHTSAPVPFFVSGPERARKKFQGSMHMTELGQVISRFIH